ncbi:MAG: nucleotidyltransferase domain-containing protein [Rhodovibrio sp.]|nr:nucleotidyltransferase domain-containing protein [Rhodovibrio sp.]
MKRAIDLFDAAGDGAVRRARRVPVRQPCRGDHHDESDADVAIVLNGSPGSVLNTKLDMVDLAYDAMLETGVRIQPMPIWQAHWDDPTGFSNPALVRAIQREGIDLGARTWTSRP